jgi:hypothetical protein
MQREQQQQKARAFWESDLPMHIRDFNEDATPGTIAYITKSFMWNFWSATGTYTQQAHVCPAPRDDHVHQGQLEGQGGVGGV